MSLALIAVAASVRVLAADALDTRAALRGYFYAASRTDEDGGFALADNRPKRISVQAPKGQLSLIALPAEFALFRNRSGFRVVLVNATAREIAFEAEDSRLSIIREAQDRSGRWRPIEYLPHSWCGNSYHRLYLPAGRQWSFAAPEYAGPTRTRMRFVLTTKEGNVYSNEFDGWIHLEQFEKREGHTPTNIMDPYDD